MKTADIKLGYACNNDCIHCVISSQKRKAEKIRGNIDRNTKEYFKEVIDSKNRGCDHIILTGGEPTIRTDFFKIIKFLNDENLTVTLQTNGRMFCDMDFTKRTVDSINSIIVSLHGSTAKINDKITRSDNNFNQTIQGLKNLVKFDIDICVILVISNYNYRNLLDFLKLMGNIGIDKISLTFPHPHGNALLYFDDLIPKYSDITPFIEECLEFVEKDDNNMKLKITSILPCALNKSFDLKYFQDFKITNIQSELKQLDTLNILNRNDSIKGSSKLKGKICLSCVYNNICHGYWKEYVSARGFDEFKSIKRYSKDFKELFLKNLKGWR